MNSSKWWDVSWNPVTGCEPVSPACDHCYARELHDQRRKARAAGKPMPEQYARPFSAVQLHEDRLDLPLGWKRPRRVFVNSMSDLYHEAVDDGFILMVINCMIEAPQHTYLTLTKRADRMREWHKGRPGLPNHWKGVTVENQDHVRRAWDLCQTASAVRFISAEPLLGPLDLDEAELLHPGWRKQMTIGTYLDWVIVGPETGRDRRPCDPEWIRLIVEQCARSNVACWVKAFPMTDCDRCKSRGPCNVCSPGSWVSHDPSEWPEWARRRELPRIAA